jgi:excisionase family DNA binding protein
MKEGKSLGSMAADSVALELLTARQVSKVLDLSLSGLYRLVQRHIIPHHRPSGKRLYFLRSEILAWVCRDGECETTPSEKITSSTTRLARRHSEQQS